MTTVDRASDAGSELTRLADELADMVLARTLPKPRWTHEAHLLVCASLVRCHGDSEALSILRKAIPRYNEATGVANTPTSGYHDTLTVFYVWAVNRLLAMGLTHTQLLHDESVDRQAALSWWDRETLFSVDARVHWVRPTRAGDAHVAPAEPD